MLYRGFVIPPSNWGDHNNGVRMHKRLQTNNVLSHQAKRTTMLPSVETESVVQGQKSALASGSRLSAPPTLEIGPPGRRDAGTGVHDRGTATPDL